MVAFRVAEPEGPLLEDRIGTIPQGQRKAEAALFVA